MKKKIILAVATVAVAAVSAKAQTLYAQAGDPLTISSITDANSPGGVLYQWYCNGTLIPGCNDASCFIPVYMTTGTNVKFQRRAIALDCAIGNTSNANTVTITFCNVVQNGVCWGDVHVDAWRTFAEKADVNTAFYQFNRKKAWAVDGTITNWVTTSPDSGNWHVDSSPCPSGWRLPTRNEYSELFNNSIPTGGMWANANSRGNSIAGRFYGKRAGECSLPDDMVGCVFFPASGYRGLFAAGAITSRNSAGYGWNSTQNSSTNGYNLYFSSTDNSILNSNKDNGYPVRCVR